MYGFGLCVAIVAVLMLGMMSLRINRQYARSVLFRLGKLSGMKGPGIFLILPIVDQLVRVDLRIRQLDVPKTTFVTDSPDTCAE